MNELADLFLKSVHALSHADAPKRDALGVISQVFHAHMPVPHPLLLQILSSLALILKRDPQLHDEAIATLQTAIDSSSVVEQSCTTELGQLQPWIAISLESLVALCRTSSADRRKRVWRLLADLSAFVSSPEAAISCFPGLFRAALSELRNNSNQLVGASIEALGCAVELLTHLLQHAVADAIQSDSAREARVKCIEAVSSVLDSLEVCMHNPINSQHDKTVRTVTVLLRVILEKCSEVATKCKKKVILLLVSVAALRNCSIVPVRLPISVAQDLNVTVCCYFQAFSEAADIDTRNFELICSAWRLLQDDKHFFVSSNSNLVIDFMRKMCSLQLPKVAQFPLSDDSLDDFSSFPTTLSVQRRELFEEFAAMSVISLDITDQLTTRIATYSKQSQLRDFHAIHELAFCMFHLKQHTSFPILIEFIHCSPPESVNPGDQQLYRALLQAGLLSLLPSIECSTFEYFLSLTRLWSEATDSIVTTHVCNLATRENADSTALLGNFSQKVVNQVISDISHSDLAASSETLYGFLKLFGPKHMSDLVKCLLKTLDTKVNRLKVNSAAGVVRGLAYVLRVYPEAFSKGFLRDGNLAREVILRLKPLLAWKREKGRNLVAFEILKLCISIAPVLDSLPLLIENSSEAAFAIHEDSNVSIPKALPALVHELFPSLVTLCKSLTQSQDYACLAKVMLLLVETAKRNEGFMERRIKEIADVVGETMKGGPATTSGKLACQKVMTELIGSVRTETLSACNLSSYLSP